MKHTILPLCCAAALALGAQAAVPTVTNVRIDHFPGSRVTVTYDLTGADGIVTVDFLTNGVSIGQANFTNVSGDVNCVVEAGSNRTIRWKPQDSWPGHSIPGNDFSARVTAWCKGAPPDYYVLDLVNGTKRFYETADALPEGIESDVYRTDKMVFRRIHAGCETFRMGSPQAESTAAGVTDGQHNYWGYETLHYVQLSEDFYLGVFEVTQAQWTNVFGSIPLNPGNDAWDMTQSFSNEAGTFPVQKTTRNRYLRGESANSDIVSYETHAVPAKAAGAPPGSAYPTFFHKLREKAGSTAETQYDLPFEAQWEFACRAGTETAFNDGQDYSASVDLSGIAVYNTSAPMRVGSKAPNAFGLYDMHGNVWEWCLDNPRSMQQLVDAGTAESAAYYAQDACDPNGESYGGKAVIRGGGYSTSPNLLRSAFRNTNIWWGSTGAGFGFRVMCPISKW